MATRVRKPSVAAALALPADVRLMNAVAGLVFALAALALLAAAIAWLARAPLFTLRTIALDGELTRSNLATLRANALPRLANSNFFAFDLAQARAAFESAPWVRQAIVRRVWPNRLAVTLEEHRAAALWHGEAGDERLVNTRGEVFEANLGDVEDETLPALRGPEGSSARMLALQRRLAPVLARIEVQAQELRLSGRGSWRAELDNGATIELGRGSDNDVIARAERFVRTLGAASARFEGQRGLVSADLRHPDGYALRLRGVTTTTAAPAKR